MPSRRLSPSRSLQKLRTVFSHSPTRLSNPTSDPIALSPTTSAASPTCSTSTASPTPGQQPFAGFAGFSFNGAPSPVFHSPSEFQFSQPSPQEAGYSRRMIRRKKSCVEIEIEQERVEFDGKLVGLVEPRPWVGTALGGIEEVLGGKG